MPAYRWIVLGVSTAINALAWGARSSFALFYVEMLRDLSWDRGPTALGYSLSWLGFLVFAPAAGWLSDRWGARAVVMIKKPFHLTPASLPTVARSAAGERQRSPTMERTEE